MIMAFPIITMSLGSHTGTTRSESSLEATALAQEGIEAVRAIRDYSWEDAEVGVHGLTDENGYWELDENIDEDLLDKYTRRIEITEISSYKKEVVVTVGWEVVEGVDRTLTMTTRLTNWNVLSWIQTLQSDFDAGTKDDVVTINNDGGEIRLEHLPDWSAPILTDSYDTDESYDAKDITVDGIYAYMGTKNNSGGSDPEFYIFNISTPGNVTLAGDYDVGGDVNAVFIDGDYAYLATSVDSQELLVLDISNKANPVQAGSYNSDEGKDGQSIFVDGNTAYLGTSNNFGWYDHEFYVLDVGNLASISKLDSYNIYNTVYDIYKDGNYAYIATARLFDELLIFNVQNPESIGYVGHYNEWGWYVGYGIHKEGDTAYFVTSNGWFGSQDFYIIDVSNPYIPSKIGSLDLGTNREIDVNGDYAYVASDTNNEELTIIDISTPSAPSEYAYYDANGDANGLWFDDEHVYLATEHDSMELQIISPSEGGDRYVDSGTFTSSAFDTESDSTSYLTISWTESGDGDLSFQIRTADAEANLPDATWVGSGGTGATYYTESGTGITLDPAASGTRWFQYQTTFEGDGFGTPVLEDLTIEYVS